MHQNQNESDQNRAQQDGASSFVRYLIPSVDLASLVSLLADAFPSDANASFSHQVITYNTQLKRLEINTYGVLRRLFSLKGFTEKFRHTDTSGFLRNVSYPSKGSSARIGGRIYADDIGGVAKNIFKLKKMIAERIDQIGLTADAILATNPTEELKRLADRTGLKNFLNEMPARMVPIEFAGQDRPASQRDKDVARAFVAIEEIQGEDWLERLISSITEAQAMRDEEFDDIQRDKLAATLRLAFEKHDSQVTRFLNFLEDEALARVRLAISFAIMQGLAAQISDSEVAAHREFVDYVSRVLKLFDLYGSETANGLHLELSRDFGLAVDFMISTELVKATFYNCLPVWAEWNSQLFESRSKDPVSHELSVIREVSYRFRVNGKDPMNESKHAFDSRIERLRETLFDVNIDQRQNQHRIKRCIAEIVFLWLTLNPNIAIGNLQDEANALSVSLKKTGRNGLKRLLDDLSGWGRRVQQLSRTLVDMLCNKSRNVITHAQRSIDDLYLVVQQGVVDWVAIERSRGKVKDPLLKPNEGQSENVAWLKHIKVTKNPNNVIDALFSIRIRTTIRELSLTSSSKDPVTINAVREIPSEFLNIVWCPICVERSDNQLTIRREDGIKPYWLMGRGIDILYKPDLLMQRRNEQDRGLDYRQYRVAAVSAMAILVYCVLQVLAEWLSNARGRKPVALMLRIQNKGREAVDSEGDPLVYAAANAVESALMSDIPVRMQGLVISPPSVYKDRGTAYALSSAFPLILSCESAPAVEKIAIVVYGTRPCDEHPNFKDADGYIFMAKTCLVEAVTHPFSGYRFSFDQMQSHVVENRDAFKNPRLIIEEVSRLHALGYRHVILISKHYGNRRINRSAQRHSPHTQTSFLDEIAANFPEMSVYLLRYDIFPAMRLHKRLKYESAFEAARLSDHYEFALEKRDCLVKQLIPVYTFGTLTIVGNDNAAKPQSGFCTYFLDTDYRIRNVEWGERARSNIMSIQAVRECLIMALRGLHFLESEKQPEGNLLKPVLDPFGWAQPISIGAAGEVQVSSPDHRYGDILVSLPALLSHITDILHCEKG